jgi:hypothetical protein
MEEVKYVNRYNDVYTFTKNEDGSVDMDGEFKWCRFGFSNVYKEAYEAYCADANTDGDGLMTPGEFKDNVFNIDEKYRKLIYSDHDDINMVDPSGGPYLTSGMDMSKFSSSFAGLKIKGFKRTDKGFKILTKPNK